MMYSIVKFRALLAERRHNRQAGSAFMGMLVGLAIFVIVQRTVVPRYSFVTPADLAIPFMPLTWAIYVLFFPFVIAVSAYAHEQAFDTFKVAVVVAFMVSIGCFQLFPEIVPRPDPTSIANSFLRQRITRLWEVDLPSNGLPSLHVSVTCLVCRMAWLTRYRWLIGTTGSLICLSTLTLKQHTLVDVVAGLLLAGLCAIVAEKWQQAEVSHGRA
ncbi:phosphatase PAP2 family protein [Massilia sp. S19_KUP03_FR1]|uniref:phosphatase PAP2 family protein n=1 Tax=Massilia sp. S19_KUP03_FR1 TaxID=3025503 RepID=UPI002FCD6EAF